jgi:hypothetical protein
MNNPARDSHRNTRDHTSDRHNSAGRCNRRSGSSIRGPSCIQTDADARCSPSCTSCTASSHTDPSDTAAHNLGPCTDRIYNSCRQDNSPHNCRHDHSIQNNLRSSPLAAARSSSSACDTSHTTHHSLVHSLDHMGCYKAGRTWDPSSDSRQSPTTRAQARETCDSSFPPKDRRFTAARIRRERVRADTGAVNTSSIGGITGRIQQIGSRFSADIRELKAKGRKRFLYST